LAIQAKPTELTRHCCTPCKSGDRIKEEFMRVRVVTDSTSDLPPEVARDLGITVVPAQIQFGEQVFLDGVELTSDEFYRRLQSSPVLPKTSPASISTFHSIYRRLAEEADAIISIHVVAKLSVTYDIARQASADLK